MKGHTPTLPQHESDSRFHALTVHCSRECPVSGPHEAICYDLREGAIAALAIEGRLPVATPAQQVAMREAYAAMKMADDANWGEFCGCCGVVLSLEAQDEECGPAHTAAQLIHAWLKRYPSQPPALL